MYYTTVPRRRRLFTDDEGQPWGLTLDSNGNIFGTTFGGPGSWGVVFEITP